MGLRAAQGVDGIADTLQRELRNMTTNLALLASSGWVETERYESLHARATEALKGTDTYLIAVDAQNHQILNTRVPWGTPLGVTSNPSSVDRAVELRKPTVSDLFFGQTAQKQVFNVVMPVISGETRVKALILTRDADRLPAIFRERPPPPGWSYAVLDGAANLVAGSAPSVGPPDLLDRLCQTDTPGLHQIEVDKMRLAAAAERLEGWGWRACAWTSSDQTEATISERWRDFTVVALVVVAVSLLLGALLGRTLTSAIQRAASVGRALDTGGEVPETRSRVREVDALLGTLTRAARRRLQQEEDLKVLLRETAHRAKNQIAIASALARLSAKSAQSKDDLRDDIVARLSALGPFDRHHVEDAVGRRAPEGAGRGATRALRVRSSGAAGAWRFAGHPCGAGDGAVAGPRAPRAWNQRREIRRPGRSPRAGSNSTGRKQARDSRSPGGSATARPLLRRAGPALARRSSR